MDIANIFCQSLGVTSHEKTFLRDGPLENLWGGQAKYKKKIRAREN